MELFTIDFVKGTQQYSVLEEKVIVTRPTAFQFNFKERHISIYAEGTMKSHENVVIKHMKPENPNVVIEGYKDKWEGTYQVKHN